MGQQRPLHLRRGILSETVFDAASGRFTEAPVATAGARPAADLLPVLSRVGERMRRAHETHLGYPYNLAGTGGVPASLGGFLINNLGDPYAGSHYASEVCDLEREVVDWLMRLWEADEPSAFWGSVGASGTEGNIWALHLAREALPGAVVLHTDEAHYSIPKAARLLRMESRALACDAAGALRPGALAEALATLDARRGVILALTCGTTVKGAHDDIAAAMAVLDGAGFTAGRRYVHVDGALNAMVLPFLDGVPDGIRPSFRHGIDSLSTSGHKMIGTPMPCGVLIARRRHVERVASAIAYLRSQDTTLMGSRNGHAVVSLWARLHGHGLAGFRADATACAARARRLAGALVAAGVPAWCNPHALTVVFPKPAEEVVRRYQLACAGGIAHAIVMPNVTEALLDRFLADYLAARDRDASGVATRIAAE